MTFTGSGRHYRSSEHEHSRHPSNGFIIAQITRCDLRFEPRVLVHGSFNSDTHSEFHAGNEYLESSPQATGRRTSSSPSGDSSTGCS
jgi:hypothetical protein